MSDVRKPPIGAVIRQHKQGLRGSCGWCGLPVTETTEVRGWFKFWHDACSEEMAIIEQPSRAREAVFARDNGICCDCGEDFSKRFVFRKGSGCSIVSWEDSPAARAERFAEQRAGYWSYTEIIYVSLWHVDHKTPLWKVAHLPDSHRLEYFKLANLITRCHRCHERKTTQEAAERAKFNRIAAPPPDKPKSKLGGRKWPPKGSTPMRRK